MNLTAGAPDLAPIGTVGVVGAGFMGAQLALHFAAHGHRLPGRRRYLTDIARQRRGRWHERLVGYARVSTK